MAGTLADQLLKMGLVSEKDAKKAAHQQRVGKKQKGRAQIEAERAERRKQAEARQQQQQAADKARGEAERAAQASREVQLQVAQIVQSGKVKAGRGFRRFYFESRDDRVPYVEVADDVAERVERGDVAVTESPTGEVELVGRDAAARIAELDRSWLRLWSGNAR